MTGQLRMLIVGHLHILLRSQVQVIKIYRLMV